MKIENKIANDFKNFINNYEYDPYEVACVVGQVLKENNVRATSPHNIGVLLFEDNNSDKVVYSDDNKINALFIDSESEHFEYWDNLENYEDYNGFSEET